MKYSGIIKKSRTLDTAALIATLGAVIQYLPMAKEAIGDNYGVIFIVLSVLMAYLRHTTTGKVGEK